MVAQGQRLLSGVDVTVTEITNIVAQALPTGAIGVATTPTIYNVDMTLADTEYSQALPTGTKILEIREQSMNFATRYAFTTGKVAGPAAPYRSLNVGEVKTVEGLSLTGKTIYFACSTAGKTMEIEVWV